MRINREELAWAAGFFDGEGTTGFYRNGIYRRVGVFLPQKDLRPLQRFQAAVGVGTISVQKKGAIHVWQAQRFDTVQHVVALLWAFWSEPKREQAAAALTNYAAYKVPYMDRSESSRRGWVTRHANRLQGRPV